MHVNIKIGAMVGGEGPGKSDRIVFVEKFKEKEKVIKAMSSQQEVIINKPEPKVRFRVFLSSESPSPVSP